MGSKVWAHVDAAGFGTRAHMRLQGRVALRIQNEDPHTLPLFTTNANMMEHVARGAADSKRGPMHAI